jgi:hypothetical protein
MSDNLTGSKTEDSGSDRTTTAAIQRERLAKLIGRLLARVMLRRKADDSVTSDHRDGR